MNGWALDMALGSTLLWQPAPNPSPSTLTRVCACSGSTPTDVRTGTAQHGAVTATSNPPNTFVCEGVFANASWGYSGMFPNCDFPDNVTYNQGQTLSMSVNSQTGLFHMQGSPGQPIGGPVNMTVRSCVGSYPSGMHTVSATCGQRQGQMYTWSGGGWTIPQCAPCGPPPNTVMSRIAAAIQRGEDIRPYLNAAFPSRVLVPGVDFAPAGCAGCGGGSGGGLIL